MTLRSMVVDPTTATPLIVTWSTDAEWNASVTAWRRILLTVEDAAQAIVFDPCLAQVRLELFVLVGRADASSVSSFRPRRSR
jgi:hypothetical protein